MCDFHRQSPTRRSRWAWVRRADRRPESSRWRASDDARSESRRSRKYPASSCYDLTMDKALYEAGLEVRKATLGKEFVENAIASADDFNRPLQEFVTEYCWGACWTRPGLPRKTRS